MLKTILLILLLTFSFSVWSQEDTGVFIEQFHERAFPGSELKWQTLWLTKELRLEAEQLLGHSFKGLRVRYFGRNKRTAWILDEIGKELPITVGVVIDNNQINDVVILEFRESRGGEVAYPFFTKQFNHLNLSVYEDTYKLSQDIDGITGATLSVRAVKKVVMLALLFHQQTHFSQALSPNNETKLTEH